jgi:hypothetical protein
MKPVTILLLAFALFAPALVYTQSSVIGVYAAEPVFPGARMAALGDATISDSYDVTCFYWNPASLAYLREHSIVISHRQEDSIHGMSENISVPFMTGPNEAIGIGLDVDHVGDARAATYANYHATQIGYDIAYGREITPTFSFGASIGVRYGHGDTTNLWAVSTTYGIVYTPSPEITYGAMLTGVGTGIVYASDRITTSLSTQNLRRKLNMGVTLRFPTQYQPEIMTLSAGNEKIFGETGIIYRGGLELFPYQWIVLRGGYVYTNDGAWGLFGLGFKGHGLRIDCSLSPNKLTDRAMSASVGIEF